MQKPAGYDETKVGGDWKPITPGGHKAIIKSAEETESKTGKPMLKVYIEFDKGDSQEGYFTNEWKNDTREDKKWPFTGTLYILTEDNEGKCNRKFKSLVTAVQNSNKGFEVVWGEDLGKQLKNKKVGIVYGEEEQEYDGRTSMRTVWRYTCDVAKVDEQKIPDPKYLNKPATVTDANGFMDVADGMSDDMPFN